MVSTTGFKKKLTIAVPTYNRAELLDKQLTWLTTAVKGFEEDCEIFVSNNCSTDQTAQVLDTWSRKLSQLDFQIYQQSTNVGAIRNIAHCIRSSSAEHIWVLSDDDTVFDKTLPYVLQELKKFPDIGLITLNFSSRDFHTRAIRYDRRYALDKALYDRQGDKVFEACVRMDGSAGGMALTSAQIYRTDLAQKALADWQMGVKNLAVQVYVTGYCAKYGGAKVTQETYLECSEGNNFFLSDRAVHLKLLYADVPQMYTRLQNIGYSDDFCKTMVRKRIQEFTEVFASKKKLLKMFLKHPATMGNAIFKMATSSM